MTKIAINRGYGGFSLSPLAVKKIAEAKGKQCHFFNLPLRGEERKKLTVEEAEKEIMWSAYTVKNPDFERMRTIGNDGTYKEANEYSDSIRLENHPGDRERADEDLVKVIEELGERANGICAQLEIIEIPDNIQDWYIDEYDGYETIREGRSW